MTRRIRASLAAAISLSAAACSAGPEVVVPAYVSPTAYRDLPCNEIVARLEAVEAAYQAETAAQPPRRFILRPPLPPDQIVQSRVRVERDALRAAARRKRCAWHHRIL